MAGAEFICLAVIHSGQYWAVIVDPDLKHVDDPDPDLYKARGLIDIESGLPILEVVNLNSK